MLTPTHLNRYLEIIQKEHTTNDRGVSRQSTTPEGAMSTHKNELKNALDMYKVPE